jgi:hypothetical protein
MKVTGNNKILGVVMALLILASTAGVSRYSTYKYGTDKERRWIRNVDGSRHQRRPSRLQSAPHFHSVLVLVSTSALVVEM